MLRSLRRLWQVYVGAAAARRVRRAFARSCVVAICAMQGAEADVAPAPAAGGMPAAVEAALAAGTLADLGLRVHDPVALVAAARLARLAGDALPDADNPYAAELLFAAARKAAAGDAAMTRFVADAERSTSRHVMADGSSTGATGSLLKDGKTDIQVACKGGERMWAAARVVNRDNTVDWAKLAAQRNPALALSVLDPGLSSIATGQSENGSVVVSWLPLQDGIYTIRIRNQSGDHVYYQYSGNQ